MHRHSCLFVSSRTLCFLNGVSLSRDSETQLVQAALPDCVHTFAYVSLPLFEDIGCLGETYETPSPSLSSTSTPSSSAPSPPSNVVLLSIKSFYNSRSQFRLLLSASAHANLNLNRYIRLMALVSTDLLLTVPSPPSSHTLTSPSSASATHSNFSRVVQVPGIYWRADPYSTASVETLRWATVACALLFFAYFGFADEAINNYCGAFQSVANRAFFSSFLCPLLEIPLSPSSSRGATLPVFIRKDTPRKRDSFDSSNMSASYGGVSPLEDTHALTLGDMSGMTTNYKESDYSSSAPSEGSDSDSESSVHGGDVEEIEVSSLHRASVHIPTTLSVSEPAHTRSSVPDCPMPVDAADIV
ncbi:pheromone A receptor-domain-containing protein [Mycena leptocephala]|nr:pheromone A receptor-domain-containing protein [Mycena leptocephala]